MATFNVATFDELQEAIAAANTNGQADQITFTQDIALPQKEEDDQGSIQLKGHLPLLAEDVGLTINGNGHTLNGNNARRPLFIKSGNITLENLTVANGKGSAMGGGLFIYDGTVTIRNSTFQNNTASNQFKVIKATNPTELDSQFNPNLDIVNGGFDGEGEGGFGRNGGKADPGEPGGFGGQGGNGKDDNGGPGGFGNVGGGTKYGTEGGAGGFGSGESYAAALGGAIFIRSGQLNLQSVSFTNNRTHSSKEAPLGLGGAIFVLHTTENTNGNNLGMPATLPTVTATDVTFSGNSADDAWDASIAPGVRSDDDVFGNVIDLNAAGEPDIAGTAEDDDLTGTEANEIIAGRQGNDRLDGSGGNDCLNGGQGDDTLIGGDGNDWLSGDLGNDWLTGGDDEDVFQLSEGQDVITDFEAWTDRLALPTGLTFADLSLTEEDTHLRITWSNAQGTHSTLLQNTSLDQITAEDFL